MVFAPALPAPVLAEARTRLAAPVMVAGDLLDVPGSDTPAHTIQEYWEAGADVILLWYTLLGAATKNVTDVLTALRTRPDVAGVKDAVTDQRDFEALMGYEQFEQRSSRYAVGRPPAQA